MRSLYYETMGADHLMGGTMTELRDGLPGVSLPDAVQADYEVISCYQDADKKQTYLVKRKEDSRKMVLKCAQGEYLSFLREEAAFFRDRNFSFLPCYMSYSEHEGNGFLFREYIEGSTIWDIVERRGAFSQREALGILKKLAGMLKMLHEENPPVIHRDLKPQNIVVTAKGECYLIDMGTARQYENDKQQDTVVVGTRMVAAPEQFGYSQTDVRTDIYAFGILMNYMLTGSMRLEEGCTLPAKVRRMILKCTAFSPGQRYQEMSEIEVQLDKLLQDRKHYKILKAAEALLMAAALLICIGFAVEKIKLLIHPQAVFEDKLLEAAVRQELGKNQGETIYLSDLASVEQLLICGDEILSDYGKHTHYMREHRINYQLVEGTGTIRDISLLQKMPNLKTLVLDRQAITDISPLKNLDLEIVSLCCNDISDISPLQNSKSLTCLYIAETQVDDISVLADKEELRILDISYTQLSTLEQLRGMNVSELSMFEIAPEDYTPLGELPLRKLEIEAVPADGIAVIGQIESMEQMTIYSSNIASLQVFKRLSGLKYLDVWGNNLRNLDGLENMPDITHLDVGENPIIRIEIPLQIHLSFLGIRNSGVNDLSFLTEMTELKVFNINYVQKQLLDEIMPKPPFVVNVWD